MAKHSSATALSETPQLTNPTKNLTSSTGRSRKHEQEAGQNKTLNPKGRSKNAGGINGPQATISKALKRRAQSLIRGSTIDAQCRAVIRYALETNDRWLPELVRRAADGEPLFDGTGLLRRGKDLMRTSELDLADT